MAWRLEIFLGFPLEDLYRRLVVIAGKTLPIEEFARYLYIEALEFANTLIEMARTLFLNQVDKLVCVLVDDKRKQKSVLRYIGL